MSTHERDSRLMDRAVAEGKRGRPSPNPHVGAIVVQGDEIVGVGYHERIGEDHAEVVALRDAGERAQGATLYVTLEPCNHVGRTAPCTEAILRAGIARVVVGVEDPNPHVVGGGADRLRAAGVVVTILKQHHAAEALLAPWAKYITTGLPAVSLKLAVSLDGRIATRTGASRWVTGQEARTKVHELRAVHDAVAVGIGTALADDPRLTVRHVPGENPLRIVFDSQLRIPPTSKLVTTANEVPTWALTVLDPNTPQGQDLSAMGVRVVQIASAVEGRIDVVAALQFLGSQGIVSMLVEGGAELAGSFLASRTADSLHAFLAPILLGPRGRPGAVDWQGPSTPTDAPRIIRPRWELCGEDAYVFGKIGYADI